MNKKVYGIKKENELFLVAIELLQEFSEERIFLFFGNLGAGKTTFIKEFCKALGVRDTVQSPSFSIINEYQSQIYGPVYHMDFYRIEKTEEAYDIGVEEYLDSGNYCFIEWPERITDLLPGDIVHITMTVQPDRSRVIEVIKG